MPFLYKFTLGKEEGIASLVGSGEVASVAYHDIFDFPLTTSEMIKWAVGSKGLKEIRRFPKVSEKEGFYFVEGKEGIVYKRLLKERTSERKFKIAQKAAGLLKHIPWVKMIAISGALAMKNASEESDVDLLIITRKDMLWISRLMAYIVLRIMNCELRKPGDKNQKDKLCLNMWLDENTLSWNPRDRNIYTAHEIAQVLPLVNKDHTCEKFLEKNKWIKEYWPNVARLNNELRTTNHGKCRKTIVHTASFIVQLAEKLAFQFQFAYMKKKITREVVTSHKAIFHLNDWGKVILKQLTS